MDPPAAGPELWLKTQELCEKWAEQDDTTLTKWKSHQLEFLQEGEGIYAREKCKVLDDLVKAGTEARKSLTTLERLYSPTAAALQLISKRGFNVDIEQLKSHVYVTSSVMAQLDNIYLKYYDGPTLGRCFQITGPSKHSEDLRRYQKYLGEVDTTLNELSMGSGVSVALHECNLQALGLKHARDKLEPLFGPLFGRVCLPLPTRSMLTHLRDFLEVDKDIMAEV